MMMKTLEKISKIAPAVTIVAMFATFVIGYYTSEAVADHDDLEKPHLISASVHDKDADAHLLMQRKLLAQIAEDLSENIAQKVVSKLKANQIQTNIKI